MTRCKSKTMDHDMGDFKDSYEQRHWELSSKAHAKLKEIDLGIQSKYLKDYVAKRLA